MITWTCHICGEEREDNRIDVLSTDISEEHSLPAGTVKQNVRHCNDRPACIEGAKTYRLVRRSETIEISEPIDFVRLAAAYAKAKWRWGFRPTRVPTAAELETFIAELKSEFAASAAGRPNARYSSGGIEVAWQGKAVAVFLVPSLTTHYNQVS